MFVSGGWVARCDILFFVEVCNRASGYIPHETGYVTAHVTGPLKQGMKPHGFHTLEKIHCQTLGIVAS